MVFFDESYDPFLQEQTRNEIKVVIAEWLSKGNKMNYEDLHSVLTIKHGFDTIDVYECIDDMIEQNEFGLVYQGLRADNE